ncbi:hypothetical protein AMTRI_Chr04g244970 [Amborella trichopoda]
MSDTRALFSMICRTYFCTAMAQYSTSLPFLGLVYSKVISPLSKVRDEPQNGAIEMEVQNNHRFVFLHLFYSAAIKCGHELMWLLHLVLFVKYVINIFLVIS